MSDEVRLRIAPSPTGDAHVGTAYMALFNLIFAKSKKGKFILRIEDTDQTRSRPIYETRVIESLRWMGIEWDEGPDIGGPYAPYRQSERTETYRKYAMQLVEEGKAYRCFATADELEEMRVVAKAKGGRIGYDRRYRNLSEQEIQERLDQELPYVIRLKVPLTGECAFTDGIRGRISFPHADIDDQILLKSDGFPTYHLANVVDDHLMKISHVLRGEEWISSTPKHLLLYEAFGWKHPEFYHLPLLLGTNGKKLSKRHNPVSITYYKASGFIPEAFRNFLTLMGYSMEGDREIYTQKELIELFKPERLGSSGAVFDIKKLEWINQQYLINQTSEQSLWGEISKNVLCPEKMQKLMPLVHTRIKTYNEFFELCDFFFINHINSSEADLTPKGLTAQSAAMILQTMLWTLEKEPEWTSGTYEQMSHTIAKLFEINHKKIVMHIFFVAITGKPKGPPLFDSCEILGKDLVRARLLKAIESLGLLSNKATSKLQHAVDQGDCKELIEKKAASPTD